MAEDGYYGYVEGEAANQINWGEIGKNMSDMLVTQKRVREEKRVAIDDASRDLGEELARAPVGTYDAGNKFILGYAENAQQYRMMTDKLLKSGELKLKDYMVGRANINSNTETLFDLTAGWQAEHAIKLQRLKENKSQPLEALLMEELEAMANLRDVTAMPDPTNGLVNLTRTTVGSDGMKKTKAITVQQMRAETSQQFDRYQLEENVSALVKNLGISEIITNSNITGGIREFLKKTDTKEKKDYILWEANTIDGITSSDFDTLSLLTVQGKYKPTTDKAAADADPSLIYVDTTAGGALPEIKFTDPQLTAAKEIIRNSIRAKIDNKVSAQYQREGLSYDQQINLQKLKNEKNNTGGETPETFTITEGNNEVSIQFETDSGKGIGRDENGVYIITNDDNKEYDQDKIDKYKNQVRAMKLSDTEKQSFNNKVNELEILDLKKQEQSLQIDGLTFSDNSLKEKLGKMIDEQEGFSVENIRAGDDEAALQKKLSDLGIDIELSVLKNLDFDDADERDKIIEIIMEKIPFTPVEEAIYYLTQDGTLKISLDDIDRVYGGKVPPELQKVTKENQDAMEANRPKNPGTETQAEVDVNL
tara:strand:- start:10919 stop:12694 length:1776 start_codon:yes stop_codon:yes gene_type:complete